jgi:hypothetical protein
MVSKDERRRRESQRQAAVNAVAAYLADQDADVYNIADTACWAQKPGSAI